MAQVSRKLDNPIWSGVLTPSFLASKLSSRDEELLQISKSRRLRSGEKRELWHALWYRHGRQWPWLEQLRPHQRLGVEAAVSRKNYALLFAQRTGKTWITGAILAIEFWDTSDALLVVPKTNLRSTWLKFLGEKLPEYSVFFNLGEYLDHQKRFIKAWGERDHCILLLNPEQLTKRTIKKLRRVPWDRFIWDEVHRLKNRASASSRAAALIAKSAKRRLALTGTPMDLNERDLWAIMRFVDASVFGDSWGNFEEYFLQKPKIDLKKKMGMIQRRKMMLAYQIAKRKAPMRPDRQQEFADMIKPYAMRITKQDAGIEPARVKPLYFKLEEGERRRYNKLEESLLVKIEGQVIKTPLKITKMGKLQQLTGGHIKDEDGEVHRTGTSKRRALRTAILNYASPVDPIVVFCKYTWEVHMIARMLRRMHYDNVAELWGQVKDAKRDPKRTNMLLGFQRGEYQAMVCQQRTGGVGVDLFRARQFFVYSMGHSYIDFDQMVSRGDHLDQSQRTEFFLLLARNSIDEDIYFAVKRKASITDQFYARLKKE
jgi:superfamily II DNA or RNA helicase